MSHALSTSQRYFRRFAARLPLGVIEILLLAPLAAILVLVAIPRMFDIESNCVGTYGVESGAGGSYFDGLSVAGTFGWLLVIVAVLFAHIAERPRLAALLPLAWFAVLVLTALVVAVSAGPLPCPK